MLEPIKAGEHLYLTPATADVSSSSLALPDANQPTPAPPPDPGAPLTPALLPGPAPAPEGAGAPVTLPPKPKPVRDLPAIQTGDRPRIHPFRAVAFGLTASTLGAGAEMAIPVSRTLNLRVGAGYLNWSYPFEADGIRYNPALKFTSGRASLDWFPHHGAFHVSAGALYFRNTIAGSAAVIEGESFSLGGTTYRNSVDDPIVGAASIAYARHVAPMLLLGFGNILPRSGRHVSMPFEFGGAYMQTPQLNLKLAGTACTDQGCFDASSTQIQQSLAKEIVTLQGDLHVLAVYPIVSLGLACRF